MPILSTSVLGLLSPVGCAAAPATDFLLDSVRYVESADGRRLIGDDGKSLGPYQLTAGAVADVERTSKSVYESTGLEARSTFRMSEASRAAARVYLVKLNGQLRRAMGREPGEAGLFACWNLGFAKFRALGFRLDRCNAAVRRAAVTVELRARAAGFNALAARGNKLAASRPDDFRFSISEFGLKTGGGR